MHRLTRAVGPLERDDGFSMVFVAVVLVMLIGMVAFAIDVAALYQERRELQTGADAAVLAIAEACVRGEACSDGVAISTADDYADLNATDSAAGIAEVDLDVGAKSIEVTAETEEIDGGTIFSPFFAQVIGFGGTPVRARASAVWGYSSGGGGLPLIISDCEWEREVGKKHDPPYDPAKVVTFYFHDGQAAEDCNAQAGQDWDDDDRLPGGFGWLVTSSGCLADVTVDEWSAFEDPGASPSTGCDPSVLVGIVENANPVKIPWFDDVRGLGAGGEYHVAGIGGIYITGYNFGGQYKYPSAASAPCQGDDRCVSGYLTTVLDSGGPIGGNDRGALVVKLTG